MSYDPCARMVCAGGLRVQARRKRASVERVAEHARIAAHSENDLWRQRRAYTDNSVAGRQFSLLSRTFTKLELADGDYVSADDVRA